MGLCSPDTGRDPLVDDLASIVRAHASRHPRSTQTAIGPSEIGELCDRRVLYRAFDCEKVNDSSDPWPSIVGIAVHGWLASAFGEDNRLAKLVNGMVVKGTEVSDPRRWLVEQRVQMTDGLSGTADLYDRTTGTVIDHKVLGAEAMRKIKAGEVPMRYRVQLHLYGYGFTRLGHAVTSVALACYPRGGNLSGLHVHREPYAEPVALAALDRLSRLVVIGNLMRLDEPGNPLWEHVEAQPGPDCGYCPHWRPGKPTDTGGCAGPTTT